MTRNPCWLILICFVCLPTWIVCSTDNCGKFEPCGARGYCYNVPDEKSSSILGTRCHCKGNYTGQWCQFVDDEYQAAKEVVPATPTLRKDKNKAVLLFNTVPSPPNAPLLYYFVRYHDLKEWRSRVFRAKLKGFFKQLFRVADWGTTTQVEVYAGNKNGVSPPVKATVKKVKLTPPYIIDRSVDQTGSLAVTRKQPIVLFCRRGGKYAFKSRWYFNGKVLQLKKDKHAHGKRGKMVIKHGSPLYKKGSYRCLIKNDFGAVYSLPINVEFKSPRKFLNDADKRKRNEASVEANLNKPFELKCPEHSTRGEPDDVTWVYYDKSRKKVEEIPRSWRIWVSPQGSLVFSHVLASDVVQSVRGFRCDIGLIRKDYPYPVLSKPFKLKVASNGKLTPYLRFQQRPPNVVHARLHHALRVFCSALSSSKTTIQWRRLLPDKKWDWLDNSDYVRVLDFGRVLEIRRVSTWDAAKYMCVVSAKGQKTILETAFDVKLKIAPEAIPPRRLSVYRGSEVRITCADRVKGAKVDWFFNGVHLRPTPRQTKKPLKSRGGRSFTYLTSGYTLIMPDARVSGVYQCDYVVPGKPSQEFMSFSGYLDVLDYREKDPLDTVYKRSSDIILKEGSKAIVTCVPRTVHSAGSFEWPGFPKHSDDHFIKGTMNGQLTINGVVAADAMTITCHGKFGSAVVKRVVHTSVVETADGDWSSWSKWSFCSGSCGDGKKSRTRACTNPAPKYGGKTCPGEPLVTGKCNPKPCKVDGGWSSWSKWSSCSVSCGGGKTSRTRTCTNPAPKYGGKTCPGERLVTGKCNPKPCKVDGGWSFWSKWSSCSVTCGGGKKSRTRTCTNPAPKYGGKTCPGEPLVTGKCNPKPCKVDGGWSSWSNWSSCSVSCGGGKKSRTRTCTNPVPKYGGKTCPGERLVTGKCNPKPCKVDGGWSSWSKWSSCSVSCGGGKKSRTRTCTNSAPKYGGKSCPGERLVAGKCNPKPCKVDGGWSSWSKWSSCSVSCGGGKNSRTRTCTNPAPKYGGKTCPGEPSESDKCNSIACKVDGGWSSWSKWSSCSVSCGGGKTSRTRTCTNPAPKYGGKTCPGEPSESDKCNIIACKVDGGWSFWSKWSSCSVSCDGGKKSRIRTCTNPAPKYGGKTCPGEPSESDKCNIIACKVDGGWSSWSKWSSCSGSCGGGKRSRTRTCTNPAPKYGGKTCSRGPLSEIEKCNVMECKVHGGWSSWSNWTSCSVTCNDGEILRTRTCTNPAPKFGGRNCPGVATEGAKCMALPCKADGGWSSWSEFSSCSVSCGDGGKKSRTRTCTNPEPKYGGENCTGPFTMSAGCENKPCGVHGGWSQWSNWSDCSTTCDSGKKSRTRTCTNPEPKYGGKTCPGYPVVSVVCQNIPCKVDGDWSSWSKWSFCSVSCGGGKKSRTRTCTNPAPKYGGRNCNGNSSIVERCNGFECKVNGHWSKWSKWTPCSLSCGSGVKIRKRTCTRPSPKHGGKKCHGKDEMRHKCHTKPCEDDEKTDDAAETKSLTETVKGLVPEQLLANPPALTGLAAGALLLVIGLVCCCWMKCSKKKGNRSKAGYTAVKTKDIAEKQPLLEAGLCEHVDKDVSFVQSAPPENDKLPTIPSIMSQSPAPPPPPPPPPGPASSTSSPATKKVAGPATQRTTGALAARSTSGKLKDTRVQKPSQSSITADKIAIMKSGSSLKKKSVDDVTHGGSTVGLGQPMMQSGSGMMRDAKIKKDSPSVSPGVPAPPPPPPPPPGIKAYQPAVKNNK